MTNPKIYTGTVGADIEIETHADLVTGVLSVAITVRKPSGDTTTWTPDSITSATLTNCVVNYRTQAADLDEAGHYRIQPVATMTNGDVWPLGVAVWRIWERYEGY